MKTKIKATLLLLLFLLLLFFVGHANAPEFKFKYPEKPVEVHVGENVILNCKSETQLDLTEGQITWKFKKTKVVYMYRLHRFHDEDYQDDQFKGRVHPVSDWKVSEGELSVEISSVKENDTGVYTCWVVHEKFKLKSNCTVTLTVKKEDIKTPGAQGDNTTTTSDDSHKCAGIGIGAFIGGLVVGAVIGALVTWKFHEKCISSVI